MDNLFNMHSFTYLSQSYSPSFIQNLDSDSTSINNLGDTLSKIDYNDSEGYYITGSFQGKYNLDLFDSKRVDETETSLENHERYQELIDSINKSEISEKLKKSGE